MIVSFWQQPCVSKDGKLQRSLTWSARSSRCVLNWSVGANCLLVGDRRYFVNKPQRSHNVSVWPSERFLIKEREINMFCVILRRCSSLLLKRKSNFKHLISS